jgi:hypothetical protein
MTRIVMLMIADGLQQPDGSVAAAPYRQLVYCRVPEAWLEGEILAGDDLWLKGAALLPVRLEAVLEAIYGEHWRAGNSDGSQYVILGIGFRLLNPRRDSERPWEQDDFKSTTLRYRHYAATPDGRMQRVAPSGL